MLKIQEIEGNRLILPLKNGFYKLKILQVELMEAIPRNLDLQDWIVPVLLGVFLVLAIVRANYTTKFDNFIRIVFSNKFFRETHKSLKFFGTFTRALFLIHTIIIALMIYVVLVNVNMITEQSFFVFIQVLLLYFVFVVGKYLVERMMGVVFSLEELLREYVFFKVTYKNFLALCVLPILIFLVYSWSGSLLFYKIMLIVFLLANMLFLSYFYRKNDKLITPNLYYFILYLCIFEIAPYYIAYNIFIKA